MTDTPTPAETAREITSKWSMEMFGNKQPPGVMEAVFIGFGNDITAALTAAHAQGEEYGRTLQMQADVAVVSRAPELYGDEHAHNIRRAFEQAAAIRALKGGPK